MTKRKQHPTKAVKAWGKAQERVNEERDALRARADSLERDNFHARALSAERLEEIHAAEAQVAALRSVGERFFDFIAGLEAFEHGNGDGDRLAGDLEEALADTAKAAATYTAAIRRAAAKEFTAQECKAVDANDVMASACPCCQRKFRLAERMAASEPEGE